MNISIHKSEDRAYVDHGWLKTWHSFNYADYFDPLRERFGVIRVINDYILSPGQNFEMHPHSNMEIITIPIKGSLQNIDSQGHINEISEGDVQIISAGSGIIHSESNNSKEESVSFLQIWIFPKIKGIQPRYQQLSFSLKERAGRFQQLVSPEIISDVLWINQDAWISRIDIDNETIQTYNLHREDNVLLIFVIEGQVDIEGKVANNGDSIEISDINHSIKIEASSKAKLLFIETPLD